MLGIGDRHLSNFMVDMESGGIVGIDFGHNFGTATQVEVAVHVPFSPFTAAVVTFLPLLNLQFLPIPELLPFRMTPQVTNLLLPHQELGQLRSCMVHVMRALRNSPTTILNTMDVFVKEPSLDWKVCLCVRV